MPKKDFKSITIPEDFYNGLQEIAGRYGTTPQNIIKIAVFDEKFTIEKPLYGGGLRFESGSVHHAFHLLDTKLQLFAFLKFILKSKNRSFRIPRIQQRDRSENLPCASLWTRLLPSRRWLLFPLICPPREQGAVLSSCLP